MYRINLIKERIAKKKKRDADKRWLARQTPEYRRSKRALYRANMSHEQHERLKQQKRDYYRRTYVPVDPKKPRQHGKYANKAEYQRAWGKANADKRREYNRKWNAKNMEKRRQSNIAWRAKLSPEKKKEIHAKQLAYVRSLPPDRKQALLAKKRERYYRLYSPEARVSTLEDRVHPSSGRLIRCTPIAIPQNNA